VLDRQTRCLESVFELRHRLVRVLPGAVISKKTPCRPRSILPGSGGEPHHLERGRHDGRARGHESAWRVIDTDPSSPTFDTVVATPRGKLDTGPAWSSVPMAVFADVAKEGLAEQIPF
jgi:hypothetical protein